MIGQGMRNTINKYLKALLIALAGLIWIAGHLLWYHWPQYTWTGANYRSDTNLKKTNPYCIIIISYNGQSGMHHLKYGLTKKQQQQKADSLILLYKKGKLKFRKYKTINGELYNQ